MNQSSKELQIYNNYSVPIDVLRSGPISNRWFIDDKGKKICTRDDLLIFNDLGIHEETLVQIEVRNLEHQQI